MQTHALLVARARAEELVQLVGGPSDRLPRSVGIELCMATQIRLVLASGASRYGPRQGAGLVAPYRTSTKVVPIIRTEPAGYWLVGLAWWRVRGILGPWL